MPRAGSDAQRELERRLLANARRGLRGHRGAARRSHRMRRTARRAATCAPTRAQTIQAAVTVGHRDATVAARVRSRHARRAGRRGRARYASATSATMSAPRSGSRRRCSGRVARRRRRADHARPVVDRAERLGRRSPRTRGRARPPPSPTTTTTPKMPRDHATRDRRPGTASSSSTTAIDSTGRLEQRGSGSPRRARPATSGSDDEGRERGDRRRPRSAPAADQRAPAGITGITSRRSPAATRRRRAASNRSERA